MDILLFPTLPSSDTPVERVTPLSYFSTIPPEKKKRDLRKSPVGFFQPKTWDLMGIAWAELSKD